MEELTIQYAKELSLLIKQKTVSKYHEKDFKRFFDFQDVLKSLFPNVFSVCEQKLFGGSLLLKWKGKSSDDPVMFMNHHDVVEAEGKWEHEPFGGEIADGKIWGRGTLDTKGGLYAMLKACEELILDGFVPEKDIYFVSSCTEEVEGSGAEQIAEYLSSQNIKFDVVYDEGGMVVDDPLGVSSGKYAMIGIAEKGCHAIKFTTDSFGGHASAPPKNSPLIRLSKFMVEVENTKKLKAKVTPQLIEMLKRFSVNMKGVKKFIFAHAKLFAPVLKMVMPKVSATGNAMLKTTVAFTMASGAENFNTIPQTASVTADMRFSHHQGSENSLQVVKKIADKYKVNMQVVDMGVESGIADIKGKQIKFLESAVNKFFPSVKAVPFISNTAADIRYMSKICDNCLRFTPFSVSDEQLQSIHGINENLDIDALFKAVEFYKYLMGRN
ncbi:MAG: M20/M25/M40 family metallo-hydrolase [Clostridia bacterium]|nr:M20/M25/M40 family metallo-hydrolase [Clostridia bacterium]